MRPFIYLLLILLTVTSTHAQEIKYFRSLVMRGTPYAGLTPKGEVKEGEIRPVDFFKAIFDDEERLILLEHYFQGKVSGQMPRGNGQLSYGSPQIRLSYQQNKEVRSYFNAQGEPMRNTNGVFKDEFELDKNGNRKSLVYYDSLNNRTSNGRGVYRYEWDVRENGALVVEKRFNQKNEIMTLSNFLDFHVTHMTFTKEGFRTGFINYGKDGKRETLSAGRKISRTEVIWDEEMSNEVAIRFLDANGHLKALDSIGSAPNAFGHAIERYDFDRLGNQTGYRTLDENGKLINRVRQPYAYQYSPMNAMGLTKILINYDQGMNMVPNPNGVFQTKFEYNDQGYLTQRLFLDELGRLMADRNGIAYISYESDTEGRFTRIAYLGRNGEPVNVPNGVSVVKFSYDREGRRTALRYDRFGRLITQ